MPVRHTGGHRPEALRNECSRPPDAGAAVPVESLTVQFALSTHWNAHRHLHGEALIDEILALGFDAVELGYDTRIDLVPGIRKRIEEGAIKANSVHVFCPVPVGAPRGHPELFTMADPDPRTRQGAIQHTSHTLRFAAEVGARCAVCHAGNVAMDHLSRNLWDLAASGRQHTSAFEKTKLKLQIDRDKRAPKQLQFLEDSISRILPVLDETGVNLCFENLPTWEAIPTEIELEHLLRKFNHPRLRYWHDIGHGQIRQNMGFINLERWLDRLSPWLAGMHVHDVLPPAMDHVMPPRGQVEFGRLKKFAQMDIFRVIEPHTQTPPDDIVAGLKHLRAAWEGDDQGTAEKRTL